MSADLGIEGVGLLAEAALSYVVLQKRIWRTLPLFTVLAIFTFCEDLSLLTIHATFSKAVYRWAYWSFAAGDYLLQVSLVAEIARTVLRPSRSWVRGALTRFIWTTLLGCLASWTIVAWVVAPLADKSELLYRRASLFSTLITCICFLTLSSVANYYHLPRRDHVRALGHGLALWNAVSLVGDLARTTAASDRGVVFLDYLRTVVWDIVLIYWATCLWHKERSRDEHLTTITSYLGTLYPHIKKSVVEE